jgi:hypothetical protein
MEHRSGGHPSSFDPYLKVNGSAKLITDDQFPALFNRDGFRDISQLRIMYWALNTMRIKRFKELERYSQPARLL